MPSPASAPSVLSSDDAFETADGRLRTMSPTALRAIGCLAHDLVGALPDPAPSRREASAAADSPYGPEWGT